MEKVSLKWDSLFFVDKRKKNAAIDATFMLFDNSCQISGILLSPQVLRISSGQMLAWISPM